MDIEQIPTPEEFEEATTKSDDAVLPIHEIALAAPIQGKRFSTGFLVFDEAMSGGLKGGDLIIISGVSGEGKTSFAQSLTYNLTKKDIACLWFSYEVTIPELDKKFMEMGIEGHYHAYTPAKNTTGHLSWIKKKITEGFIKYGTRIIFIDHIDFLTPLDMRTGDNREIALKNIAIQLKSLAIEQNIVIVLLAHVKKIQDGREPDMQDIGYSAGIFQLADYVFMVSRERTIQSRRTINTDTGGDLVTNNAKIKIVKNRQTGRLIFHTLMYAHGKFNEIDDVHREARDYFNDPKDTR